jgi:flagellar secretion chaperone FliS
MNPYSNARQAYAQSSVMTASPEQLVVMLYDGALRFLRQSAEAMRAGQREQSRNRMRRAEAIIEELNTSLDMSHGQIPARLRSIYLFCNRQLILANVETDASAIDAVIRLLGELREAWYTVANASTTELVAVAG